LGSGASAGLNVQFLVLSSYFMPGAISQVSRAWIFSSALLSPTHLPFTGFSGYGAGHVGLILSKETIWPVAGKTKQSATAIEKGKQIQRERMDIQFPFETRVMCVTSAFVVA
jgi:hypothetical protein